MYKTEKQTRRFSTKEASDMEEYDAILNNPLCTILDEEHLKETARTFDGDGGGTQDDTIVKIITWEEKKLL